MSSDLAAVTKELTQLRELASHTKDIIDERDEAVDEMTEWMQIAQRRADKLFAAEHERDELRKERDQLLEANKVLYRKVDELRRDRERLDILERLTSPQGFWNRIWHESGLNSKFPKGWYAQARHQDRPAMCDSVREALDIIDAATKEQNHV